MKPDRIISERKSRNWSQADLAAKLRVNQSQVSRWEKGKVPLTGPASIALETIFTATVAEAQAVSA